MSRVPSRLPKPQGEGPFRGAACCRWPAAAATRTWGRARGGDQATRLLRLGSPRGRRAGKSQARVQEAGARPGGQPGQCRSVPAMSQGLHLLLLGCGRDPEPDRSPSYPRLRLGGLAYAALSLPLSLAACSLAPAMAMREVTVACSETADLPCTASWDPQLSYAVSWVKVSSTGFCAVLCGDSGNRHLRDRVSGGPGLGTLSILIPHFLPPRFIRIHGPSPLVLVPRRS